MTVDSVEIWDNHGVIGVTKASRIKTEKRKYIATEEGMKTMMMTTTAIPHHSAVVFLIIQCKMILGVYETPVGTTGKGIDMKSAIINNNKIDISSGRDHRRHLHHRVDSHSDIVSSRSDSSNSNNNNNNPFDL